MPSEAYLDLFSILQLLFKDLHAFFLFASFLPFPTSFFIVSFCFLFYWQFQSRPSVLTVASSSDQVVGSAGWGIKEVGEKHHTFRIKAFHFSLGPAAQNLVVDFSASCSVCALIAMVTILYLKKYVVVIWVILGY